MMGAVGLGTDAAAPLPPIEAASGASGDIRDGKLSNDVSKPMMNYFDDCRDAESALDASVDAACADYLSGTRVCNRRPSVNTLTMHFSAHSVATGPSDPHEYVRHLVQHVVLPSTRVSSPYMVGHMTSALPYFQRSLSRLVTAMNQNVVKVETSSTATFLEHEAIAKLHHAFYGFSPNFYAAETHSPHACLGVIGSGGTVANITALWCARNAALGPRGDFPGVERSGLHRALRHYGYEDAVIIGSENMHYSFVKAADILGIGTDGLVRIPVRPDFSVDVTLLEEELERLAARRTLVIAVVGVAGATETGAVDRLDALADVCARHSIHFHVDAAWGGPLVFSERHRGALAGIERAHSITVDGHKQLFTPIGCGVVLFHDARRAHAIRKSAQYIIRVDSHDSGRFSLEGSRPAAAVFLHASLSILGRGGLATLIDQSIDRAEAVARIVSSCKALELVAAPPHSNILLYRWIPAALQDKAGRGELFDEKDNLSIDEHNRHLQERQTMHGAAFVSRTTIRSQRYGVPIVCLRVVLANPRSDVQHMTAALDEQEALLASIYV